MVQIVSSASRASVMAQVKTTADAVRSHQDCADVYSDMATVSSSAGESAGVQGLVYMGNYIPTFILIRVRFRDCFVATVTERLNEKFVSCQF